ncbi:SUKH-4 family immunity protein, partial [Streptomyces sp. NPDC054784]
MTYAQAQERAERWINGDVPVYQQREVRVQEFGLGYVAWSEARQGGPVSEGARSRMVIARDTGDATLWPGLPVDEVIRRYEQEYGADAERSRPAPPREPLDLEATSFLLTPPEWLQEAADRMGVPDNRPGRSATPPPRAAAPAADANPWDAADTSSTDAYAGQEPPATVFAPPISGSDDDDTPPPPSSEAKTALMPEGSGLPKTAVSPALKRDRAGSSSDPTPPPAASAPSPSAPASATPPPSAPSSSSSAPSAPSSAPSPFPESGPAGPSGDGTRTPPPPSAPPQPPGGSGGGAHHAATVLADPSQGGGSCGGSFGGAQGSQGGRGAQGGTPPPPSAPPAPLAADAATDRAQRGS